MRLLSRLVFGLLLVSSLASPAIAKQTTSNKGFMPARGITMDQVKAQYGAPIQMVSPVGNPPISRWIYDGYVVFFEYQRVLHSLVVENGRGTK